MLPISDVRFDYTGQNGPSVSHVQQMKFQTDFLAQLAEVQDKYKSLDAALSRTDFYISVSEAYDKSRALVPAWEGQRGWMEFPAHRVVAGQASIAHELVHVLFPNGNRMLAEGLAVYLQYKLFPSIPVYPNFGDHLEALVAEFLYRNYPKRTAYALWNIDLDALEKISTPDELTLRIGRDPIIGAESGGPNDGQFVYAVAGSLVSFLLENPIEYEVLTASNFAALYQSTPLRPLERDSGDPDRWGNYYQGKDGQGNKISSFHHLGLLWKTYMHFVLCSKFATGKPDGIKIPETSPENYWNEGLVKEAYRKLNDICASPAQKTGKVQSRKKNK